MGQKLTVPQAAEQLLARLEDAGFAAFVVGGCVRDSLLGVTPHDWDICTAATPEKVMEIFADRQVIPTGLKHGTVTVVLEGESYEITTFRTEAGYSDGRHPDRVAFVTDVREDLARRDFTINAMAYSPVRGLADPFGGETDLEKGVLRCVGDPAVRFTEDALRMMRLLRFHARLGFRVEERTRQEAVRLAPLLCHVSRERITEELLQMLAEPAAGSPLRLFRQVIFTILPELAPEDGFDQHSLWHQYPVYEHSVQTVELLNPEGLSPEDFKITRLAALLHDIGKPSCFTLDDRGNGHFFGHPAAGEAMVREMCETRLRLTSDQQQALLSLVRHHDDPMLPDKKHVRKALSLHGEAGLFRLIALHRADQEAHGPRAFYADQLRAYMRDTDAFRVLARQVLAEEPVLTLQSLAIRGQDLAGLGVAPGPAMGVLRRRLLSLVLEGSVENETGALKEACRKLLEESAGAEKPDAGK